jgi:hypothetical protein
MALAERGGRYSWIGIRTRVSRRGKTCHRKQKTTGRSPPVPIHGRCYCPLRAANGWSWTKGLAALAAFASFTALAFFAALASLTVLAAFASLTALAAFASFTVFASFAALTALASFTALAVCRLGGRRADRNALIRRQVYGKSSRLRQHKSTDARPNFYTLHPNPPFECCT